jgi:hypothetical protein
LTFGAILAGMDTADGPARPTRQRAGVWLVGVAAALAAAMVLAGVVAGIVLQRKLAVTSNVYVDWHGVQQFYLDLGVAATVLLAMATVGALMVIREWPGRRALVAALAGVLVFAGIGPSVGWFALLWDDMFGPDRAFNMATYGHWYLPLLAGLGAGQVLALGAAVVLLSARPRTA